MPTSVVVCNDVLALELIGYVATPARCGSSEPPASLVKRLFGAGNHAGYLAAFPAVPLGNYF
jgi:hypothetical protein